MVLFTLAVHYVDELDARMATILAAEGEGLGTEAPPLLHTLRGKNSDSGTEVHQTFPTLHLEHGRFETHLLHHILSTARVTKSEAELAVMWYVAHVASNAHVNVMRSVAPNMFEFELEARFLYEIYKNGGCRRAAYISICACGPNSAVLHYGHAAAPNDRPLLGTDMALLDMGADYHGYVSDITCSVSARYI
jgi:Xaa-Pro dipeptidase